MGKRGRKTKFNKTIRATVLRLLSEENKTEDQVAEIVGISRTTLANWKGAHPDFAMAVREAKQMADELVEAALFSRAVGYSHPETKVICSKDLGIVHEQIVKHLPPDTTAAMFWLRNRQPERWREKNEGDVTVNNTLQVDNLSDEQLNAKIAAMLAKGKPQGS